MSLLRIPAIVLASLLIPGLAGATTLQTGKPAASQPAAQAFATRDQLRECLDIQAALKVRLGAIEVSSKAHERMFNELEAENAKLQEIGGSKEFDHANDATIEAYNSLAKHHNQHVKQLNHDAAESQLVSDAYNADMQAYNHKCSALVYLAEDLDAVLKERNKAAVPAGAASAP